MKRMRGDISELEWHDEIQAESVRRSMSEAGAEVSRDDLAETTMAVARRIVAVVQPKRGRGQVRADRLTRGVQCRTCALIWLTCPELMGWREAKDAAEYLGITPQTFQVHVNDVRAALQGNGRSVVDGAGLVAR